jgi:hypothetical protein
MNDYDLMVLIPWGSFGIAFIFLCVWLQISSRRSRRDQALPARRGAGAGAEPAATMPLCPARSVRRVATRTGCTRGLGLRRPVTVTTPSSTSPAVADASIPGWPYPAPGSRTGANTGRVMAVVAVSAPGRPNWRPAWRG